MPAEASGSTMTVLILCLMTGMSAGLAIWAMIGLYFDAKDVKPEGRFMTEPPPALLRLMIPFGRPMARVYADYHKRVLKKKQSPPPAILRFHDIVERNLLSAGVPLSVTVADIVGVSFASMVIGGFYGWFVAETMLYPGGPFALVGLMLGGALPFLWLNDRLKRRQLNIRKSLPYMLDLLTLCVGSGLDFSTALARIIPKMGNSPLRYELEIVMRELQVGKARSEALRDMAYRINLIEVSTVVSGIIQSDELGTALGPVLKVQSDEARRRRMQRAEELALKAPVKIIFPLVAFIFPTTFIIVFGPIFISYVLPMFK